MGQDDDDYDDMSMQTHGIINSAYIKHVNESD